MSHLILITFTFGPKLLRIYPSYGLDSRKTKLFSCGWQTVKQKATKLKKNTCSPADVHTTKQLMKGLWSLQSYGQQ